MGRDGWIDWVVGRWWRVVLVSVACVVGAVATTVAGVAVNVATGGSSPWLPMVQMRPLWWMAGGTLAVAAAGALVWWTQRQADRGLRDLVPAERRPEPWVVSRPVEGDQVVSALCRRGRSTVGITTAVQGAGGFGKTTVAKLVGADPRVLRRFGGRIYWVTLGRDVRPKAAIADKVNDLIAQLEPDRAVAFTDPAQAGQYLAALLKDGPRRLVVLDDVWYPEQEAAFPVGGRSARLLTTRIPSLVADQGIPIRVDQVNPEQARAVLTAGLPALPDNVIAALLAETGLWPLLLRLVNKLLADQLATDLDATATAWSVVKRLRRSGPLRIDELTGAAAERLDVNDPQQRQRAVQTTIEASAGLLTPEQRARFAELAIFAEDETVPVTLIHQLWQRTGGLDEVATRALCARLHDLALLATTATGDGGVVSLHDVVRDYLHEQLGPPRVATLHQFLLDAIADSLPRPVRLVDGPFDGPAGVIPGPTTAWWELDESARYLWDHLIEHLMAAGRVDRAEALAADLRWVSARLEQAGPVAPYTDLTRVGTSRARTLQRVLGQVAHLLTPTDPRHSVVDILYSRLDGDPRWGPQAVSLAGMRAGVGLRNRWQLPDRPHPAQLRLFVNHLRGRCALAVAPDGSWLACATDDGVRVWDLATGTYRIVPGGSPGSESVENFVVAPDSGWLACAGPGRTLLLWDVTTWTRRAVFEDTSIGTLVMAPNGSWLASSDSDGHIRVWDVHAGTLTSVWEHRDNWVTAMAVAPDGSWLATGSAHGAVRLWDVVSGTEHRLPVTKVEPARRTRAGFVGTGISALVVAPDGSWLAASGADGAVHIWDVATSTLRTALNNDLNSADALAVAPDSSWLAFVADDHTVWICDVVTGTRTRQLGRRTSQVHAFAVAPDGSWLATAENWAVRIWDTATGDQIGLLEGHANWVYTAAAGPDGSWLASAGFDGTIRIWDVAIATENTERPVIEGHGGSVLAVAFAPDGAWLASGSSDQTVLIWDLATAKPRAILSGHEGSAWAVAVAPDSTWLVSGGNDGTVRLWDASTGTSTATLTGHTDAVRAVSVAPDGSWVASGGFDGTVRIWSAADGTARSVLDRHTGSVRATAVAPDGTWLASASADGTVRIWDAATWTERAVLDHASPVLAVDVASDGSWLVSGGYGTVRIWDVGTWICRAVLNGHKESVTAVAAAPNSALVASTGLDRTVRIWDPTTGKPQAMMRIEHAANACAWAPDGRSLAVGGGRERPYLFDFRSLNS